jgi:regulator of protease activity HflC (stomatin/prohibitin superfamily)
VLELLVALLAAVVVAALLFRFVIDVVTVHDYQRGVRFRNGKLVGLLSTGTHLAVRPFSEIQLLDGRPTSVTVPRQEILTADGVAVKVTLAARYVVVDPVTAVTGDQSWLSALYASLQAGLRSVVAGRSVDELVAVRADLGSTVAGLVASDLARIGIELLGVDVRDVMVPGELKRASVAIVAARRDAEAAVERARGEGAALRSLANVAPLLDEHPGLVELRAIQGAETRSGKSPTLGLGDAAGGPEAVRTASRRPRGNGPGSPPANGSGTGPDAKATRTGSSRPDGRSGTEA